MSRPLPFQARAPSPGAAHAAHRLARPASKEEVERALAELLDLLHGPRSITSRGVKQERTPHTHVAYFGPAGLRTRLGRAVQALRGTPEQAVGSKKGGGR